MTLSSGVKKGMYLFVTLLGFVVASILILLIVPKFVTSLYTYILVFKQNAILILLIRASFICLLCFFVLPIFINYKVNSKKDSDTAVEHDVLNAFISLQQKRMLTIYLVFEAIHQLIMTVG